MARKAIFSADGEPANLPAAALDALEWLRCWRGIEDHRLGDEDRARLGRCIAALETELRPHLPHRFETRREFPDAVAVMVVAEEPGT